MLNASPARQLLDVGYKPQSLGVMGANSDLDLVNSAFDKVINDVNNKTVSNGTVKMFGMWSILENPMRMVKQATGGGMVEGLVDYSTKPEVQRDMAFNAVLAHPAMGAVGGAVMSPVIGYQAGQEARKLYEGQSVMGGNAEIDRLKGELSKFDAREFAKNNPASVLTSIFPASSIGKRAGMATEKIYHGTDKIFNPEKLNNTAKVTKSVDPLIEETRALKTKYRDSKIGRIEDFYHENAENILNRKPKYDYLDSGGTPRIEFKKPPEIPRKELSGDDHWNLHKWFDDMGLKYEGVKYKNPGRSALYGDIRNPETIFFSSRETGGVPLEISVSNITEDSIKRAIYKFKKWENGEGEYGGGSL